MSNQMTGLYQKPSGPPVNGPSPVLQPGRQFQSLQNSDRRPQGGESSNNNAPATTSNHINPKHRGSDYKVSLGSSNGSESVIAGPSRYAKDDDDLEIIEEFNPATTNHPHTSTMFVRRSTLRKDKTDQEQLNEAVRGGSKALPDSVVGVPLPFSVEAQKLQEKGIQVGEKLEIKVTQDSSTSTVSTLDEWIEVKKPVKRSREVSPTAAYKQEKETRALGPPASSGTKSKPTTAASSNVPKKLKKEIHVVQESNYTFADFGGSEKVLEVI